MYTLFQPPFQAVVTEGPLKGIRGLCIFSNEEDSYFFLAEKAHQHLTMFYKVGSYIHWVAPDFLQQVIDIYGEDAAGRWMPIDNLTEEPFEQFRFDYKIPPPLKLILSELELEVSLTSLPLQHCAL